jgi:Phosphodiester glycosidase
MRISKKVGRFRAVIAAVVLAIGALAAVPASTQSAIARDTQPAAAQQDFCMPGFPNEVPNWAPRSLGGGVILCEGTDTFGLTDAWVQIVDLNAGAKVRLISESCPACPFDDTEDFSDLQYHKRTAPEWFDLIENKPPTSPPSTGELFSTSNGSFFTDTSAGPASPLSLPEESLIEKLPNGDALTESTVGKAWEGGDDAWDSPKRAISFGDHTASRQKVEMILDFPMHYTRNDFLELVSGVPPGECCVDWDRIYGDQTVGFTPDFVPGDLESRRTYVGVDSSVGAANTVYILTTDADFSNEEAQIMLASFGAAVSVQLDGGSSTQLYGPDLDDDGEGDNLVTPFPDIGRTVPDTLAVYLAP